MSGAAGLGGFAKGFGAQLLANETRRAAAQRQMAESMFSAQMQNPNEDVIKSPQFQKLLKSGFGSDAPLAMQMLDTIVKSNPYTSGPKGEAPAPPAADPTAGALIAPEGAGAPSGVAGGGASGAAPAMPTPSAGQAPGAPTPPAPAAGAPLTPGALPPPKTEAERIERTLPAGATYKTPFGTIKSTKTAEGQLEANFQPVMRQFLDQFKRSAPYASDPASQGLLQTNALQGAVAWFDTQGRGAEVPQSARKILAEVQSHSSSAAIDLAMKPLIGAAEVRARSGPEAESAAAKAKALAPIQVDVAGREASARGAAETSALVERETNPFLQAAKSANAAAIAESTARGTATGALPFKIAEGERAAGLQLFKQALKAGADDKGIGQQITAVRAGLERLRPAVKVFTKNPIQALSGLQWFGVQIDKRSRINPQRAAEIGMVDSFAALAPVISKVFGDVGNIAQAEREEIVRRLVPSLGLGGDTDVSAAVKMDILAGMMDDIDTARKSNLSPDAIADRVRARYTGYLQSLPPGVGMNPRAVPPSVPTPGAVQPPPTIPSAPAPTTPPPVAPVVPPSGAAGGGTPSVAAPAAPAAPAAKAPLTLDQVNALRAKYGHPPLTALPTPAAPAGP